MSVLAGSTFGDLMRGAPSQSWEVGQFQAGQRERQSQQAQLDQARINADSLLNQVKQQGANELDRLTLVDKFNRRANARAGLLDLGASLMNFGSGDSSRYAASPEIREQLLRLAAPGDSLADFNKLIGGLNTTQAAITPWKGRSSALLANILNSGQSS